VLSNYLAAKLLEASVANASFASGAQTFLALLTAAGTPADTGTTLSTKEAAYGGYARAEVASSVWAEAEGPYIVNAEPIPLAKRTSGAAQIVAWAICDAVTKGNVLHLGDTATFIIDEADPEPIIGAGLLRVVFA
jgi:hypothetical protein